MKWLNKEVWVTTAHAEFSLQDYGNAFSLTDSLRQTSPLFCYWQLLCVNCSKILSENSPMLCRCFADAWKISRVLLIWSCQGAMQWATQQTLICCHLQQHSEPSLIMFWGGIISEYIVDTWFLSICNFFNLAESKYKQAALCFLCKNIYLPPTLKNRQTLLPA